MSFPIKGNNISSIMQRKHLNDRKKALDERDTKIDTRNDEKNSSEFIEIYRYKKYRFRIINEDGIYRVVSPLIVVGDKDLEVLKNEKISEYVENAIKNRGSIY